MKSLVVFYSRTGTAKRVALEITKGLQGDSEEIIDQKDRKGAKGFLIGGGDAALKKTTEINQITKDPSEYDLVVIGTPVWSFTMAPAVRTYIMQNKQKFKKVAFFCTAGNTGLKTTLKDMQDLCGQKPSAVLELTTKEVVVNEFMAKVSSFISDIA